MNCLSFQYENTEKLKLINLYVFIFRKPFPSTDTPELAQSISPM